ncbi:MAG: radical SAM protein [Chloroflexi bacterium]|nr:radical SAM protein [Chloroflexota bacterium]
MSVLKIHLSYQCSAECDHCHLRAGRRPNKAIAYDLALNTIVELKRLNNLELVVLLGGEPGLFPDLTHRLVGAVSTMGIATRVETNASWATDDAAARAFLGPLYAAGTSVMLSLDAFHETFIDPGCVERAMRVSEEYGGHYNLEIPYVDAERHSHPRDRRTDVLLREVEQHLGHSAPAYKGPVLFKGRAAHTLAPEVAGGRGIPAEVCAEVPWWHNGSQRTLQLLGLDPHGYLSKECGIAIGNVATDSVQHILETFDAERHPILSTLITTGPLGLAREAQAQGYTLKRDYADKCHLCQEAREALRGKYPQYLVPEQQYTG